MKRLSLFIVLLSLLACESVKAQINVKTDPRVAPLLRQAANGQSNLVISGRKAASTMYVNIAVLDKTNKTLSWFTCYGTAYDSVQLKESEYQLIVANAVDPFVFYKDLCLENEIYLDSAASEYRRLGKLALKDTVYNRRVVYNSGQVRAAHSTLQQLMAIESLMKKQYLKLCLFNSPSPSQLSPNDNFRLYESLAGKMVSRPDSTIYYATSPLGVVTKIALYREDSLKMFVYDGQDHVLDSMPLRSEKYAALLESRDDVFLLYRGWLELQSQQVQEALRQTAALLHRQDTGLYIQAYRVENRKKLLTGEMLLKAQQGDIERKISALIVPDQQMVEHMLRDAYPDGPAEMTYLSAGMGFAYTVSHERGEKLYELSDHRGNMMAAVSDKKVDVDNGAGTIAYYNADVVNANDYYPFGSLLPGRTYSENSQYRYGFNGKEQDSEMKGAGNQYDYGFRIYDPRIGRFLSTDPLSAEYPWNSAYAFAENDVIRSVDLEGAEKDVRTFSYTVSNGHVVAKVMSDNFVQPEGTFHIGFKSQTTKEIIAVAFVESNRLPAGGTFSFFEFSPATQKDNYARYDYRDVGGKQQSRYFSAEYVNWMFEQLGIAQEDLQNRLKVAGAIANLAGAGMIAKAELKEVTGEVEAAGALASGGLGATVARIMYEAEGGTTYASYEGQHLGFYEFSQNEGLTLDLKIPKELQGKGLGGTIFKDAMSATKATKFTATWIEGSYYDDGMSVNLSEFNKGIQSGLDAKSAAWQTPSGKFATQNGFTSVDVKSIRGGIQAVFKK